MASGLDKALEEFRLKLNQQRNTLQNTLQGGSPFQSQQVSTPTSGAKPAVTESPGAGPAQPKPGTVEAPKQYPQYYSSQYKKPDMSDTRYKNTRVGSMFAGFEIGQEVSEKSNNDFFKLGATMGAGIAGLFRPDLAGQMRYKKDMDMYNNAVKEENMQTAAQQSIRMNDLKIKEAEAETARQQAITDFDKTIKDAISQSGNQTLPNTLAIIDQKARELIPQGQDKPDRVTEEKTIDAKMAAIEGFIVKQGGVISPEIRNSLRSKTKEISDVSVNGATGDIYIKSADGRIIETLKKGEAKTRNFESDSNDWSYMAARATGQTLENVNSWDETKKAEFQKRLQEAREIFTMLEQFNKVSSSERLAYIELFLNASDPNSKSGDIRSYGGTTYSVTQLRQILASTKESLTKTREQQAYTTWRDANRGVVSQAPANSPDAGKWNLDFSSESSIVPARDGKTGVLVGEVPQAQGREFGTYSVDLSFASPERYNSYKANGDAMLAAVKATKKTGGTITVKGKSYEFRKEGGKIYVYDKFDSTAPGAFKDATTVVIFDDEKNPLPTVRMYGPHIGPPKTK